MGQVHPWESRSRAGQHAPDSRPYVFQSHDIYLLSSLVCTVRCQGLARCLFAFWSCPAKKSSGAGPALSLLLSSCRRLESGRQRLVIIFFLFFG